MKLLLLSALFALSYADLLEPDEVYSDETEATSEAEPKLSFKAAVLASQLQQSLADDLEESRNEEIAKEEQVDARWRPTNGRQMPHPAGKNVKKGVKAAMKKAAMKKAAMKKTAMKGKKGRKGAKGKMALKALKAKKGKKGPRKPSFGTRGKKDSAVRPIVGSDRDTNGCIGSAGYSWCSTTKSCVRPWETPCPAAYEGTGKVSTGKKDSAGRPIVGSDRDTNGCIGSAGYSWCSTTKSCVRPWETPCPAAEEATGCCESFGYGSMMKKCCHKYDEGKVASECDASGLLGGGMQHHPGLTCAAVQALKAAEEATGCCESFGFGSRMKRCCHKYDEGKMASECDGSGLMGGGMQHHPGLTCAAVQALKAAEEAPAAAEEATGCCESFGYGSMMKKCCHKYAEGKVASECDGSGLMGGGMQHHPGLTCASVQAMKTLG